MIKLNSNFLKDYPKSYGSIEDYRFQPFLDEAGRNLFILDKILFVYFKIKASKTSPRRKYKDYKYIGSGWEWSAFRKDKNSIIKIPAGIFAEVNDKKYLINTEYAYKKISSYFPEKFMAKSEFKRESSLNIIEQEYINGKSDFIISYKEKDKELLKNVDEFLNYCLLMLEKEEWSPDFSLTLSTSNNIIFVTPITGARINTFLFTNCNKSLSPVTIITCVLDD